MEEWYALRVKSRREKYVANCACNKGYDVFLPVYGHRHRWSDRFKIVELPLFPGYVFCRLDRAQRVPLLMIPGVLHIVSTGKSPVPIDDMEIDAIRAATDSQLTVEPYPFVGVGQRVRLQRGPLKGFEGILLAGPDHRRVVISLSVLKRSVVLEVEPWWISPVELREFALPFLPGRA